MPGLILPSEIDIKRELARRTLLGFTRQTFPKFKENWHHAVLSHYLTGFAMGLYPRLMLFMPPRHGKTESAVRRLSAFIFGRNPDARIIGASYGAELAGSNSKDIQAIMSSPEYQAIFPKTKVGGKKATEHLFTINGHDGYYRAAGVDGGIGGYGASYGVIDDPIKNEKEAESLTVREGAWGWYRSTFYPRLESPGHILLSTTRWHEDDLAGRLIKEMKTNADADQWVIVNLPALFEIQRNQAGDIINHIVAEDPRAEGEALWPEFKNAEELRQVRGVSGPYFFSALFQGTPQAAGGTIFKREWFKIVAPHMVPQNDMTWCRYWDSAGTEGAGDWTAGVLVGYHQPTKTTFIKHVIRGQWSTGTVDAEIQKTAKADGTHVRIREEREGGSSGLAVVTKRQHDLIGFDYRGKLKTGKKETEWKPLAAQCEGGNVFLVQGPWNNDFIDELVQVPKGHDDQADAAAGGFNELVIGPGAVSVVKLAGFG